MRWQTPSKIAFEIVPDTEEERRRQNTPFTEYVKRLKIKVDNEYYMHSFNAPGGKKFKNSAAIDENKYIFEHKKPLADNKQ